MITASPQAAPSLAADRLSLGYREHLVVDGVSVTLPRGRISTVLGANGCGKSTLLRGLARLIRPRSGMVLLDGDDIAQLPARALARALGMLPQQPIAPDGITVADLIGRGRHPHQRWFRQWSEADDAAVTSAMRATSVADLADRPIDELSGGQRQRVWIALALAQDPQIMLLDEPTTYLDLAHQIEVLELLVTLNRQWGRSIVLVLHDINLACRYTHHLIMMRDGAIVAEGAPADIVTSDLIKEVFGVTCQVIADPLAGTPLILPQPGILPQ